MNEQMEWRWPLKEPRNLNEAHQSWLLKVKRLNSDVLTATESGR